MRTRLFALIFATFVALLPGLAAAQISGEFRIDWEVKNRFRLFRDEHDFLRHVTASHGDGVLAAERRLALATDGRGWARLMLDHLCIDAAGAVSQTCERDGVRENYLHPQDYRVGVVLTGPVPSDATCAWTFNDGETPAQRISVPCGEEVTLRVGAGKTTVAAVALETPAGTQQAAAEIAVRDLLIAGLGDSVASGEGNPDRPVALADNGFCFRRFLGTARSEYFRPSRAGFRGDQACESAPGSSDITTGTAVARVGRAAEWQQRGARWMSAACHRSLYSYQTRTALQLAVENPHIAVTYLPLACTGASIGDGLFDSQRARECPPRGGCPPRVPGQLGALRDALARAQRPLDLVLLTVGANDISFSGLVGNVIVDGTTERVISSRGGAVTSVEDAQRVISTTLPGAFAKLRAALKPLVGGDLHRVVYVSYGHPALQADGTPCPGGRDGFDVHPAFKADPARLAATAAFVAQEFLPRIKALASCTGGTICNDPATDAMTMVDAHQPQFLGHGFCARAETDPVFDRTCLSPSGETFQTDPVKAAEHPLLCPLRPSEYRPYASRARWERTADDSYLTAMTYPEGLPSVLQPRDIHDALWGVVSAVYGGAIHPTAEGHAVMADATLPAARMVLGLNAVVPVSLVPPN
ncbi:MAG TPA: hypothetical protein VFB45_09460 [Pseudolabrys sp.]|nr:hypothetical protein [Pseudolabrys sp.]